MVQTSHTIWRCRERMLICGSRTRIMGILNVTPDSFSDGGQFQTVKSAVDRGLQMLAEGADILDIGGESTRPGAAPVDVAEEIRRTVPVIQALRQHTDALISIDTRKAEVARAALDAGADIVNDISAGSDARMAAVVAESGAGWVLMHMQGTPQTMQNNPQYADVVSEVRNFFQERMAYALSQRVAVEQVVMDPGIGFGKTDVHNLALLRNLGAFAKLGRPVLMGASRKSVIGRLLGREPADRLAGSLALAVFSVLRGAP
ncbi:MAG: dihydropteroate synthase, partial [Kiritimatiellaceae bacterium]|nr:dihydropteroate synthase [Kiritimatiellaceae bacterium]